MTHHTVSLHGLKLEVEVTHAFTLSPAVVRSQAASDHDADGYSELDWHFMSGTDEIGAELSFKSLDFLAKEYESAIESEIWKSLERMRDDNA